MKLPRILLRGVRWLPAAMILSGIAGANAPEYPLKPLRIVTSEAGGGNDVPARIVAQGLTLALGQQVVIENRPSGVVPAEIVAKAAPQRLHAAVLQQRAVDGAADSGDAL